MKSAAVQLLLFPGLPTFPIICHALRSEMLAIGQKIDLLLFIIVYVIHTSSQTFKHFLYYLYKVGKDL